MYSTAVVLRSKLPHTGTTVARMVVRGFHYGEGKTFVARVWLY